MRVVYLFIDGLGLSAPACDNPVNVEVCPSLMRLLGTHSKPIDACLGVEGFPQSATGQSTMFTGRNCAKEMGRHCEGFPPAALRKIIEEDNLFLELKRRGKRIRFADAYLVDDVKEIAERRFKSVTTVMALTVPETISMTADLMANRALMQDITRDTIQENYPDIPRISPLRAAEHLFEIALKNDFTLYEFYLTDVIGHSLDYERACTVLRIYDRFLGHFVRFAEAAGITVVITSDHGNLEAVYQRGHTKNPVPFIAYGPNGWFMIDRVESLVDVTPAILEAFDKES